IVERARTGAPAGLVPAADPGGRTGNGRGRDRGFAWGAEFVLVLPSRPAAARRASAAGAAASLAHLSRQLSGDERADRLPHGELLRRRRLRRRAGLRKPGPGKEIGMKRQRVPEQPPLPRRLAAEGVGS